MTYFCQICEIVKHLFYMGIAAYLLGFLHEIEHLIIGLCFNAKLLEINFNFFNMGVAFEAASADTPLLIRLAVSMGPLLINILLGVILLIYASKIAYLEIRRFAIIVGGVFLAYMCFIPLDIYYIQGDVVSWTTSVETLLFLRRYYWVILFLCIPLIYFAVKVYFESLHPNVVSLTSSVKICMLEIVLPIILSFILLFIGFNTYSVSVQEDLHIFNLDDKYLYHDLTSSKNKRMNFFISSIEDVEEINEIIADRKFTADYVVFFIEENPAETLNSKHKLLRFKGKALYKGNIVRIDFVLQEITGNPKYQIVGAKSLAKTIPDSPESPFPALFMFGYYCFITVAVVFYITYNRRKKLFA